MNTTSRTVMAAAALTLSATPLALAPPAFAEGGGKAAVEYAERQAAGNDGPSKAQIEQREREQARSGGTRTGGSSQQNPQPTVPSGSDGGAAAWQLALSAALGAVTAGGVLVAARQVNHHRHPVASAH